MKRILASPEDILEASGILMQKKINGSLVNPSWCPRLSLQEFYPDE